MRCIRANFPILLKIGGPYKNIGEGGEGRLRCMVVGKMLANVSCFYTSMYLYSEFYYISFYLTFSRLFLIIYHYIFASE